MQIKNDYVNVNVGFFLIIAKQTKKLLLNKPKIKPLQKNKKRKKKKKQTNQHKKMKK